MYQPLQRLSDTKRSIQETVEFQFARCSGDPLKDLVLEIGVSPKIIVARGKSQAKEKFGNESMNTLVLWFLWRRNAGDSDERPVESSEDDPSEFGRGLQFPFEIEKLELSVVCSNQVKWSRIQKVIGESGAKRVVF